jgi:hypothetical protein
MRSILVLWTCVAVLAAPSFVLAQEKEAPEVKRPQVKLRVKGAEVRQLKGLEAGRPLSALPGVKTITSEELGRRRHDSSSGLYLVDTDFVPRGLEKTLQTLGYRLEPDGKLVERKGRPVTLFYKGTVFAITPKRRSESAPPPSDLQKWGAMLKRTLIPEAQAASPVPLGCIWMDYWAAHDDWVRAFPPSKCHKYVTGVTGEAGGKDPSGGCDWASAPYTKVWYLMVNSQITFPVSRLDHRYCQYCDRRSARTSFTQCHCIGCAYAHPLLGFTHQMTAQDPPPPYTNGGKKFGIGIRLID